MKGLMPRRPIILSTARLLPLGAALTLAVTTATLAAPIDRVALLDRLAAGIALTVTGEFRDGQGPLEAADAITFADGTTLTRDDIVAQAVITGTAGADIINLPTDGFTVNSGQGDDSLSVSGTGAGVILFAKGDGHDVLDNPGSDYARSDTLRLVDISEEDVTLTRNGDALDVTVQSTGDNFHVNTQFSGDGSSELHGLSVIQFADGSAWDRSEIENRTLGANITNGGPNETLEATDSTDTFSMFGAVGDEAINGFASTGSNHDYLEVSRNIFSDWAHLLEATRQQGADLLIAIDPTDSIRLSNVALSDFSSKDIKFAAG